MTATADFPKKKRGRPPVVAKVQVAERASEIAAALFERASHLDPDLDGAAVSELSRLCALAEGLDADIEKRGLTTGSGGLRAGARLRIETSRAIATWTSLLGANPKARAEIVGALREVATPSFNESYQRRLRELREGSAANGR
jgi:hypothetical protein